MKFFLAVFTILAVFAFSSAYVLPEIMDNHQMVRLEDVDTNGGIGIDLTKSMIRRKRFTCDLMSIETAIVTPNHSACALKCIGIGRNGGHCEGTTCICRDDKSPWGDFLDLF